MATLEHVCAVCPHFSFSNEMLYKCPDCGCDRITNLSDEAMPPIGGDDETERDVEEDAETDVENEREA